MDKLSDIRKRGWNPPAGSGGIRNGVVRLPPPSVPLAPHLTNLLQKGWMGKGNDPSAQRSQDHESAPLSSLRDPSSFGPPPKSLTSRSGSDPASPSTPTASVRQASSISKPLAELPPPDSRGLGAGLTSEELQPPPKEEEAAEEEARRSPEEEQRPFQANTTGLPMRGLPKPPVRRAEHTPPARTPVSAPTGTAKPKPALPPRLPPRSAKPAAPPSYDAATAGDSSSAGKTMEKDGVQLNQGALNRLGAAGVRVPALGIGRDASTSRSPDASGQDESGAATPLSRLSLARDAHQSASAAKTLSQLRKDPSSVSAADARGAAVAARDLHARHGDTVRDLHARHGDKVADFRARHGESVAAGFRKFGGALGGGESATSPGAKKGPPPPPPPKRTGASPASEGPASPPPPPVPMATKPQ